MKLPAYLRSIPGMLRWHSQIDTEMEEELGSHIQLRADDLQRGGLSRAQAERQARVEFGPTTTIQGRVPGGTRRQPDRDALDGCADLRASLAQIWFTIVASLTLALADWGECGGFWRVGCSCAALAQCAAVGKFVGDDLWGQSDVAVVPSFSITGFGIDERVGAGNFREPGARGDRLSGDFARPAGIERRGSGYGAGGAAGHLDSSATRAHA